MQSRKYIKRVWRVPKDRGAPEFLSALVVKALVKHGWPARAEVVPGNWGDGFQVLHKDTGLEAADDFWQAVSIACRIVARTQRADIDEAKGLVMLLRDYTVTPNGFLREVKT